MAKFCAVVVPWGRERLARQLQAARRVRQKKKKNTFSDAARASDEAQPVHVSFSFFSCPFPIIGSAQLAPSRAVRSNKLVEHCSLSLQPQGQMLHNMRKAVQDKERRRWRRSISFLRTRVARLEAKLLLSKAAQTVRKDRGQEGTVFMRKDKGKGRGGVHKRTITRGTISFGCTAPATYLKQALIYKSCAFVLNMKSARQIETMSNS